MNSVIGGIVLVPEPSIGGLYHDISAVKLLFIVFAEVLNGIVGETLNMFNTDYFPFSVHHLVEGGHKVAAARSDIKSSLIRLQDILKPFL